MTALFHACGVGTQEPVERPDVVRTLLRAGAKMSVRDDEGNPTSLLNASARSEEVTYMPGRGLQAAQDMYQAYD